MEGWKDGRKDGRMEGWKDGILLLSLLWMEGRIIVTSTITITTTISIPVIIRIDVTLTISDTDSACRECGQCKSQFANRSEGRSDGRSVWRSLGWSLGLWDARRSVKGSVDGWPMVGEWLATAWPMVG